ncbi:MAG: hypothetical protein NTW29_07425 [Bacteroidetes bacterium]|nr:hypothetical protein [Bacteroidota bacterium]
MNKFNIEEFRLFKTCSLLNLSLMSARPPDEYKAYLMQREIQQNNDIYYRSKTIQQYDTVTVCVTNTHHFYLINGGISNESMLHPVLPMAAKKVKQVLKEKAATSVKKGRELLVLLKTDNNEQPDFSSGMLKDFIVKKMVYKLRGLSAAETQWLKRSP